MMGSIERLREWCDATIQGTPQSQEWVESVTAWKKSRDGFADALCGLQDSSFPYQCLCYAIIAGHDPSSLPDEWVVATLRTLLSHLRFGPADLVPFAADCWQTFLERARFVLGELAWRCRLTALQLAEASLAVGDYHRGFTILRSCIATATLELTRDELAIITPLILSHLEKSTELPPWMEAMLDAFTPLWVALGIGASRETMILMQGTLRPTVSAWTFAMLENAVRAVSLSPRELDVVARLVYGFGNLCSSIRNSATPDQEFLAERDRHFCELAFQLVLKYPKQRDLSFAFVARVVPLKQAWPADALPPLLLHLMQLSLLSDADVRLADENAMDYWWQVVEPEAEDSAMRASSLALLRTEALLDFAAVRDAFIQIVSSTYGDWRVLEVLMRYMALLTDIQNRGDFVDESLVEVAVALIGAAAHEDCFPIACMRRYLLAQLLMATRDPGLIQLAQQAARQWLIIGGDEMAKIMVTIAFTIVDALCEVDAVSADIVEGVLACAGQCLTWITGSIFAHFAEMGLIAISDHAAVFARKVIDETEEFFKTDPGPNATVREKMILPQWIENLCILWSEKSCIVDLEVLESLLRIAIEHATSAVFEVTIYSVFKAVLAQVGPDHDLGQFCLQNMAQRIAKTPDFLPDCICALIPIFSVNWRVIPLLKVLDLIRLKSRENLADLEDDGIIPYFTFSCRLLWGAEADVVEQWTSEHLAHLEWLASLDEVHSRRISPLLLEILEMEVVLTRLAAGIVDGVRIQATLASLHRTAISDYHRLLAVATLGPLLAQHEGLAEEFGPTLQAILESRLDAAAVADFQAISRCTFFDETPAPVTALPIAGFVTGRDAVKYFCD
jgi:hypothetical protein